MNKNGKIIFAQNISIEIAKNWRSTVNGNESMGERLEQALLADIEKRKLKN